MREGKINRTCIADDSASPRPYRGAEHADSDHYTAEEVSAESCAASDCNPAGVQQPGAAEGLGCGSTRPSCPTCRCCVAAPPCMPCPFAAWTSPV